MKRLLAASLFVAFGCLAQAQDPPEETGLDIAAIHSRIALTKADAALDDATKKIVLEHYEDALDRLRAVEELATRTAEYDRLAAEAPNLLSGIRGRLSRAPEEVKASASADATVDAIEQLRASVEAELSALRGVAETLRAESKRRAERRNAIAELIAKAKQSLGEVTGRLAAPAPAETPQAVTYAHRQHLLARRTALRAEITMCEQELASYEARKELLPARIDHKLREVSVAEKALTSWQELAARRREAEAQRAKLLTEQAARDTEERLRQEATESVPELLALAESNKRLAELRVGENGLSAKLARVGAELTAAKEQLAALQESFKRIRRKVDVAGLTNAMGQLLRKRLEGLPDVSALERGSRLRKERISNVQFELILSEDKRAEVGDIEQQLEATLAGLDPVARRRLDSIVRDLLTSQRDLLDALIEDSALHFQRLVELDQTSRRLLEGAQEYGSYIEERILWVRSVPGSAIPNARSLGAAVAWLFTSGDWPQALGTTAGEFRSRWPEAILWVLLLVVLVGARPFCRRASEEAADAVWKPDRDAYPHTLRALVYALVLAAPLPLLLWGIGWWLSIGAAQVPVGVAVGLGLKKTAVALLALETVRQVLRPRGLGDAHFRWRSTGIKHLQIHLRWFIPTALTTTFLVETLYHQPDAALNDSLGRIAFFVMVVALAVFTQRVLRPTGPVFHIYMQRNRGGWIDRLRYLWYPLTIGLPLVLGLLALRGYYYSALRVFARLQTSLWLILLLILINALLIRWLRLSRSRLVLQQIAAQEEAARLAAEAVEREMAEAEAEERAKAEAATRARAEAEGLPPTTKYDSDVAPIPTATADAPPAKKTRASTLHVRRTATFRALGDTANAAVVAAAAAESNIQLDFEEVDHAAVSSDLQRLFRMSIAMTIMLGFAVIWADVLPALKRLDQVQVWPQLEYVEPEQVHYTLDAEATKTPAPTAEEPAEAPAPATDGGLGAAGLPMTPAPGASQTAIPVRVTLADVGLAIIIFMFTLMATKNVPGLLSFLLLERVALDAGARYAFSTVARYAIVLVGVTAGFGVIGFRWDNVQWLVAALTFGLAFGLQEIFANFVSGLIILFERPVRLGDWVTVGDVTGVVTRIRIRATTITDLNRKELIVPNRAFVTGNVINWALTDSILRLVLPIGVAYGSDTKKTRQLLLEIANSSRRILNDPAPDAFFLGFGASSLEFELHAYIDHPAHQWIARHELHDGINRAFAEGGLEIAFPQRDLHIRSADPGLLERLITPMKRDDVVEPAEPKPKP